MKKAFTLLIIVTVLLSILSGCSNHEVLEFENTDGDAVVIGQ